LLALAYCAEALGRHDRAAALYRAVWRRDWQQVSAAFGLARIQLARGKRDAALAELEDVPKTSQHAGAATVARVVLFAKMLDTDHAGRPTDQDLANAAARFKECGLTGEARHRLRTAVCEAAYCCVSRGRRRLAVDGDDVFGNRPDGKAVRRWLERHYRGLAAQARNADEHAVLVDLANEIRPMTLT
jgi:serine/threonine-protein kinase PknG